MAKEGRSIGDAIAAQGTGLRFDGHKGVCDIIQMRLGVNPAWDGQANELKAGIDDLTCFGVGLRKHDGADLDRADAALKVKGSRQGLPGEVGLGNVRQEGASIHVNGMPARGFDDGHA